MGQVSPKARQGGVKMKKKIFGLFTLIFASLLLTFGFASFADAGISGQVRDAMSSKSIAGVNVYAWMRVGEFSFLDDSAMTTADGNFTLGNSFPTGQVAISFSVNNYYREEFSFIFNGENLHLGVVGMKKAAAHARIRILNSGNISANGGYLFYDAIVEKEVRGVRFLATVLVSMKSPLNKRWTTYQVKEWVGTTSGQDIVETGKIAIPHDVENSSSVCVMFSLREYENPRLYDDPENRELIKQINSAYEIDSDAVCRTKGPDQVGSDAKG